MSKLLSGNNAKVLDEVKNYWLGMALHLFGMLALNRNESRYSNEVRAVILGRLAALGLAMHQYFGKAVEDLGFAENKGVLEASLRTHDAAAKHMAQLEYKAGRQLN